MSGILDLPRLSGAMFIEDLRSELFTDKATGVRQTQTLLVSREQYRALVAPWQQRHNEEIKAQTLFVRPGYRTGPVLHKDPDNEL